MKEIGWKLFVIVSALPFLMVCAFAGAIEEVRIGCLELQDDWTRYDRLKARADKEG